MPGNTTSHLPNVFFVRSHQLSAAVQYPQRIRINASYSHWHGSTYITPKIKNVEKTNSKNAFLSHLCKLMQGCHSTVTVESKDF